MNKLKTNVFFHGDCLFVMKHDIPAESIDLIYLDPPFFTGRVQKPKNHDKVCENYGWNPGAMQISYDDSRSFWGSKDKVKELRKEGTPEWLIHLSTRKLSGEPFASYLLYMMERLQECHRILKSTGSIYLHCDWRASHYLKMVMDEIFGYENFKNEIVWSYNTRTMTTNYFAKKHDIIFFYGKNNKVNFNSDIVRVPHRKESLIQYNQIDEQGKKYKKQSFGQRTYLNPLGQPCPDIWEIQILGSRDKERIGYPTQKPEVLLKRIILASSKPKDVILDPFCGCGTTIVAAHGLDREWIGIDINNVAIEVIKNRCTQLKIDKPLKPIIIERTFESIMKIVENSSKSKGQKFEKWVNEFYDATKPYPDDGVDGIMEDGTPIQVKSYIVSDSEIRRFAGDARDHPKVPQPCNRGLFVAKGFNDNAIKQVYKTKESRGFEIKLIELKDMLKIK